MEISISISYTLQDSCINLECISHNLSENEPAILSNFVTLGKLQVSGSQWLKARMMTVILYISLIGSKLSGRERLLDTDASLCCRLKRGIWSNSPLLFIHLLPTNGSTVLTRKTHKQNYITQVSRNKYWPIPTNLRKTLSGIVSC